METNKSENCKRKLNFAGVAIMAGLIVLGIFIAKGLGNIARQDEYITVKGLAERQVMANKVVWPLPYKCVSNNIQELYNEIERNNSIVLDFLKDGGIENSEIIV